VAEEAGGAARGAAAREWGQGGGVGGGDSGGWVMPSVDAVEAVIEV
jgi:hypothetical protein